MNYLIAGPIVLLILTPHIIWLTENDYITITYGIQRTGGIGNFFDHLIYPIIFTGKQIGILIPFLLMFYFLIKKIKIKFNFKDEKLIFIFFTTFVPFILIFFTSMLMGAKIRTMWMTPFYLFFGVALIYLFKNEVIKTNLKKFILILSFFLLISPTIYLGVSSINENKRTDYPGKEIAYLVQNKWNKNFTNEIKIVIGDEWSAGNLSYHLRSRPKWMLSLEDSISNIRSNEGVIYTGNPQILKKVCPGVFGVIKPVGYCMIGQK